MGILQIIEVDYIIGQIQRHLEKIIDHRMTVPHTLKLDHKEEVALIQIYITLDHLGKEIEAAQELLDIPAVTMSSRLRIVP